jgi:hypothetical protein
MVRRPGLLTKVVHGEEAAFHGLHEAGAIWSAGRHGFGNGN